MEEAPPSTKIWDVGGFKEQLFAQIIGCDPNAFLTQLANIKPDKHGKGGVSYDKKATWLTKIIAPLKADVAFKDAVWPSDHQAVMNFVDRVIKANAHLFTSGREQDEPAEAGSEDTKCARS